MARTTNPKSKTTTTRRKPGPAERAKIKSQEQEQAAAKLKMQEADQKVMRDLAARMTMEAAHAALDRDMAARVRDAVTDALLRTANKIAEDATSMRSTYLLAGCTHEQVPSSAIVMMRAAERLQEMAREHAGHPIPASVVNAGA